MKTIAETGTKRSSDQAGLPYGESLSVSLDRVSHLHGRFIQIAGGSSGSGGNTDLHQGDMMSLTGDF